MRLIYSFTVTLILFSNTIFSQSNWIREPYNPVLLPGGTGQSISLWQGSILLLDGTYHFWYHATATTNGSFAQIFYARSSNGLNWTKYDSGAVLSYGSAEEFDCQALNHPSVIFQDGIFKMWYTGVNCTEKKLQIGYAESFDGISWRKYRKNPVLSPGGPEEFDFQGVRLPNVKYHDDVYKMWYFGFDGKGQTGYATSPDGIQWEKYAGNPVLTVSETDNFDTYKVEPGDLVINGEGYHLFYSGQSDTQRSIGYAHSTDGINWTKYDENPFITAEGIAWENVWFNIVDVEYSSHSGYTMWYSAGDRHIGRSLGVAYSKNLRVPTIKILPFVLTDTLKIGESSSIPFDINNSGLELLSYSIKLSPDTSLFENSLLTLPDSRVPGQIQDNGGKMRSGTQDWMPHQVLNHLIRPVLRSLGFWIELSDAAGKINPDESRLIEVRIDASELNPGAYEAFLQISHNDPTRARVILPLRIVVTDSTSTPVYEENNILSQDYKLIQNYPNPFNPTTTIEYHLPRAGQVLLTVYNLRGEEVERLVERYMSAGLHTAFWDASNLPSGIYFYRFKAGTFVQTRKMVLLK